MVEDGLPVTYCSHDFSAHSALSNDPGDLYNCPGKQIGCQYYTADQYKSS